MREIVLDTETTGLGPEDRIVEIGCVEIVDLLPTGRTLHMYVNPQRESHAEAIKVHGLTTEFLRGHPTFRKQVDKLLEFIGDDQLVIHNAKFDMKMLNAEMERLERPALANPVVDTLKLSREQRPGKKHTLDALCGDYKIDRSRRSKHHGALIDSEILAEVYLALRGGRQHGLELGNAHLDETGIHTPLLTYLNQPDMSVLMTRRPAPLQSRLQPDELIDHLFHVATIPDAIWGKYEAEQQLNAA